MGKGFCQENNRPGGCQLPNIHCGYPDCDIDPSAKTSLSRTPKGKLKKKARKQVMEGIGELQDLIGHALSAYRNDRDPERAHVVTDTLEKAFNLAVRLRD